MGGGTVREDKTSFLGFFAAILLEAISQLLQKCAVVLAYHYPTIIKTVGNDYPTPDPEH